MKFSPPVKDILKLTLSFAKKKKLKLYIVGGYLRDALLGRRKENLDIDFCLKRGAINFGRALAKKIRAGFVVLDKEHGACRLVKKMGGKIYTLDFTDFRGPTLEKDLLHRDFTINAIALELEKAFAVSDFQGSLIDPCSGREDLKKKVIKAVNKNSFSEDPLRILRAFSFSSGLGFAIDKETLKVAKRQKQGLTKVSAERIREELFKIFAQPQAYEYLLKLDELRILEIIFPEIKKMRGIGQGPYHHLDVWQHTLETVKQLEGLLRELKNKPEIQEYLNVVVSSERRRSALLKLAALLHDIGKPAALRHEGKKLIFHGHERIGREMTEEVSQRLKLSNDEIYALKVIVMRHLRPGYLADNAVLTPRAKFRYFRDAGSEAVAILLLSIADQRATKGPLTTADSRLRQEKTASSLIREYFKKSKEKKMPRLLNGNDLMREFKLAPSPLIGKMLSELEELRAIGKVKSKKEALKAAARLLAQQKRKK